MKHSPRVISIGMALAMTIAVEEPIQCAIDSVGLPCVVPNQRGVGHPSSEMSSARFCLRRRIYRWQKHCRGLYHEAKFIGDAGPPEPRMARKLDLHEDAIFRRCARRSR
jgi:hypothetical protein